SNTQKHTEEITNEKLGTVKVEPSVKKLEECQTGEGILQAGNELNLVRNMVPWKPLEPLVESLLPAHRWKWRKD
uniref:Uncharacterized protein n=1 Tax=Monodon monoceros TaxID=40151 RepID=A0A8C6C682_MONMO